MATTARRAAGPRSGKTKTAGRDKAARQSRKAAGRTPSLRQRLQEAAGTRWSRALLALVAYTESFVLLIPPDVLLVPMVLAQPRQWFRLASIATAGSVAGALTGYAIGVVAFESLGQPLLEFYGLTEQFESFASDASRYGAWAVVVAGITPLPFKVATILSGSVGLNLAVFAFSCLLARGIRFALVAWVMQKAGRSAAAHIEKRFGWIAATALVAAFVVILLVLLP